MFKKDKLRKMLYSLFNIVLLTYVLLVIIALLLSNRMMFPAPSSSYEKEDGLVRIPSGNGSIVARYYYKPDSRWTILYSHGNHEDLGSIDPLLQEFHRHGYSILAYDYRGYGLSTGTASESNSYEDVLAAYKWLVKEKGVPPSHVVAMGYSIGGGPTSWLAENRAVGAVILQATFVSAFRVVTRIPLLPFDRFPNYRRLKNIFAPILFIHGRRDMIVPFTHGKTLSSYATSPARVFWIDGAGHNDLVEVAGEQYWEAIETFLNEVAANH
jgi:pimeloyl-ACP methyl ester carboxylesterase